VTGPAGLRGYNRRVSRFYGIDDANSLLPGLAVVVERLRDQRAELVNLRDLFRAREGDVLDAVIDADGADTVDTDDPELRRLRLRMRGIVDQMQADVVWLDERAIVLRDIRALVPGRQVWLCWRLGEEHVGWWHGVDEGFDGRRPLSELDPVARA